MKRGVCVALVLLALYTVANADFLNVEAGTLFGYDDSETSIPGPSYWGTLPLSQACSAGKRQSPIDIPLFVPLSRSNGPLTLAYRPSLVNVGNNGHSFVISSRSRYLEHSIIFVQNLVYAPLGYRLFQMHLHWGRNNTEGSEHTLNGQSFPLEAHFVHYNSRFASIDAAVRSGDHDALIVVGIFFQVGATTPPSLTSILNLLPYYTSVQQETEVQEYINLADMYPKGLEYYTYLGSFTTPMCNEVNRWIVLARPVSIKQSDLDRIRTVNLVLSSTRTGPGKNFRPLQPLNGRKVTASFNSLPYIAPPSPPPGPAPAPTPTPLPQDPGNPQMLEG